MPSLTDAIAAVEQAQSGYTTAQSTLTNDQALIAAKQAALDAANAQVATDTKAAGDAATALNSSLDALIAAATAAKVAVG